MHKLLLLLFAQGGMQCVVYQYRSLPTVVVWNNSSGVCSCRIICNRMGMNGGHIYAQKASQKVAY